MNIQFGKESEAKTLDENGSTVTTVRDFLNGEVKRPIKKHYEIRVRVTNQKEEQQEYLEFSDDVNRDPSKLDPYFRLEKSALGKQNGYYYVIKCYTVLVMG